MSLESAIRSLVAESPDNRYQCLPGGGPNGTASYSQGKCTNGSLGCLIGQGIIRAGGTLPAEADELFSLGELIQLPGMDGTDDEQWFYDLQGAQDSGHTWKDSLEIADNPEPCEC